MKQAQFNRPLTVALSEEVFVKVKKITDNERISMAEWVRNAVDAALKNSEEKENHKNEF